MESERGSAVSAIATLQVVEFRCAAAHRPVAPQELGFAPSHHSTTPGFVDTVPLSPGRMGHRCNGTADASSDPEGTFCFLCIFRLTNGTA